MGRAEKSPVVVNEKKSSRSAATGQWTAKRKFQTIEGDWTPRKSCLVISAHH